MLLDIIVTHYNEPWKTGKKFFDMLALQRGISFDDFRVLLVNDGQENAIPAENFTDYPYQVDILTINHGGVSVARNAGIDHAAAKWVNFCDFDDTYASVHALREVLNVLKTDAYDLLFADFISEDKMKSGETLLHRRGDNSVFIHAKYWRLEWLKETGIKFDPALKFNEDSAFCAIANNLMDFKRTGQITTDIPIYVWCFSENSATTTPGNRVKCLIGLYERNKVVCESFRQTGDYKRYCGMVSRTVHDAYWSFNLEKVPEEMNASIEDFRQWWKEHKQYFFDCDPELMKEVVEASRAEHEHGDREEEARFLHTNDLIVNKAVGLSQWLFNLEGR